MTLTDIVTRALVFAGVSCWAWAVFLAAHYYWRMNPTDADDRLWREWTKDFARRER